MYSSPLHSSFFLLSQSRWETNDETPTINEVGGNEFTRKCFSEREKLCPHVLLSIFLPNSHVFFVCLLFYFQRNPRNGCNCAITWSESPPSGHRELPEIIVVSPHLSSFLLIYTLSLRLSILCLSFYIALSLPSPFSPFSSSLFSYLPPLSTHLLHPSTHTLKVYPWRPLWSTRNGSPSVYS